MRAFYTLKANAKCQLAPHIRTSRITTEQGAAAPPAEIVPSLVSEIFIRGTLDSVLIASEAPDHMHGGREFAEERGQMTNNNENFCAVLEIDENKGHRMAENGTGRRSSSVLVCCTASECQASQLLSPLGFGKSRR